MHYSLSTFFEKKKYMPNVFIEINFIVCIYIYIAHNLPFFSKGKIMICKVLPIKAYYGDHNVMLMMLIGVWEGSRQLF